MPYTTALEAEEPPWTVAGVLSGIGLLWGKAGIGKSFVACSLAASVATGRPWLGHRVTEGPVVYVVGEGGLANVAHRLDAAIANLHCCDPEEPPPPIWIASPGVDLVKGPGELTSLILAEGVSPQLIIIDTLSRCFTGDENKQEDMGKFVRSLDLLRDMWDASILVIHHANRAGEIRGSSVLYGAVDVSLQLQQEGAAGWRIVADKLRDRDVTAPVAELRFEERVREGRDEVGDVLTTRVVRPNEEFERWVMLLAGAAPNAEYTYDDWRRLAPEIPKGLFDRLVTEIVGDPETWGIEFEDGVYKRRVS